MFKGVIHANARAILPEFIAKMPARVINICSGNFTLETTLRLNGFKGRLEGCDISLYTSALGRYFAGDDWRIAVKPDADPDVQRFGEWLTDPEGKAAVIAVALDMTEHAKRRNDFQRRMWGAYMHNLPKLIQGTKERLRKKKAMLKLDAFHARDGAAVIAENAKAKDVLIMSSPPTYCLGQNEPILTANLEWIPCRFLKAGDIIIAFDEERLPGERHRNWRLATVTQSIPAVKECVRVGLENGDSVVCTTDHPWLADRYDYCSGTGTRNWVRADRLLQDGPWVLKRFDVWRAADSFDAGWIAGMMDGEGSVHCGQAAKLSIIQKPGVLADHIIETLTRLGFRPKAYQRPGVLNIDINGGWCEILRALGTFRPIRLLENFAKFPVERWPTAHAKRRPKVRVVSVEPLGPQPIQSISTSTGTYIGAGYLMHNTNGYEKLYATLMSWFDWDAPTYTDIGPKVEFAKLMKSEAHPWLMFSEDRNPDVEAILGQPKAQTARGPNKNVYLYTGLQVSPKLIRREVECSANHPYPRFTDRDEITPKTRITFVRTSFKEANYFRQLYSSVIPMQARAQFCYLFMADGKAFGQVMLSLDTFDLVVNGERIGGEYLYMMSDLPIASERYPRLSKLVLAASTSAEFRAELEHRTTQSVKWLYTTAFSEKPVSMKYRGVYDFHSRKGPDEKGHFTINYVARLGEKPMAQLLREWLQKHVNERNAPQSGFEAKKTVKKPQ